MTVMATLRYAYKNNKQNSKTLELDVVLCALVCAAVCVQKQIIFSMKSNVWCVSVLTGFPATPFVRSP
jgi:hypothetical protein